MQVVQTVQTTLLAPASAGARSAEFTVLDNPATLTLFTASGVPTEGVRIGLELKVNGVWTPLPTKLANVSPLRVAEPGTYSLLKPDTTESIGVAMDQALPSTPSQRALQDASQLWVGSVLMAVPDADFRAALIRTGVGVATRLHLFAHATDAMRIELYQSPTFSSAGTVEALFNTKLGGPAPLLLFNSSTTITANGTKLYTTLAAAGRRVAVGGDQGWHVPASSTLMVRCNYDVAGVLPPPADVVLEMVFSEEPN